MTNQLKNCLITAQAACFKSGPKSTIENPNLLALMAWYNYVPSWRSRVLPIFIAITLAAAIGFWLLLAALNVKYRDRYIVPFIVQLGVYISPVGFSSDILPLHWRLLYSLNPMFGVIDGFGACDFGWRSRNLLVRIPFDFLGFVPSKT